VARRLWLDRFASFVIDESIDFQKQRHGSVVLNDKDPTERSFQTRIVANAVE
jgi:hypothetical protein